MKRQTRFCRLFTVCLFAASANAVTNRKLTSYKAFLHRDFSLLDESERRYAENGLTHVDFLIYNKVGRQPVLVIETDGHQHHKEGSRQKERDIMKDRILELYGIPCERLKTTESNERERIETRLKDVLHIN